MKILFVETMILGHHASYIKKLSLSDLYESVIISPEIISDVTCKQYIIPKMSLNSKKMIAS